MLCALLDDFAVHGRELVVMGAPRLREIARAAIEPGRRDAGDGGWKLALLALRLLGDKQAFDDLSIDYCVTYEVSPPSWEPMPANVRVAGPGTGSDAARAARASSAGAASARSGQVGESGAFALRGEIAGRMAEELVALRGFAHGAAIW